MMHLIFYCQSLSHTALTQRIASVGSVYIIDAGTFWGQQKHVPHYLYVQSSVGLSLHLGVLLVITIFYIKMYSSSDIAIACLIGEIRSDHCFVPGFENCEL